MNETMRKIRCAFIFAFCSLVLGNVASAGQELFGPIHFGVEGPFSSEAAYYRRTDSKGEVKALVLFTKEFRTAHTDKEAWFSAVEGEATPNKDHDLRLEFGDAKLELTRMSAFVVVQGDGSLVFLKPFKVTDLELFEYMKAEPANRSLEGVRKLGEKFVEKAGEKVARVPDLPDSDLRKKVLEKQIEPVKFTDAELGDVATYLSRKTNSSVMIRSKDENNLSERLVAFDFKGGTVKDFFSALSDAADVVVELEQYAIVIEARDAEPAEPADQRQDFPDPF